MKCPVFCDLATASGSPHPCCTSPPGDNAGAAALPANRTLSDEGNDDNAKARLPRLHVSPRVAEALIL